MAIKNLLAPAPPSKPLPEGEVKRLYPIYRWRVMESTFIGYAMFYLVRNNFSPVGKELKNVLHYTDSDIGSILGIAAITYGVGKFLTGAISDRSDSRKFMALGLFLTAICNFVFGASQSFNLHMILWGLNGFFQGMGWPPCGRSMGHWFAEKERGLTFSIWNTAHNVGGGLAGMIVAGVVAHFKAWQYGFYFPGAIALIGAIYLLIRLVDTPQSVGLPPIEQFKGEISDLKMSAAKERELSTKELFINYVLGNKLVWLLAIANFFAYVSRYSMVDWGPMYLQEMKHADIMGGGLGVMVIEFSGIPSTILLGWLSDRIGGRRGVIATLCMIPIMAAFVGMLLIPTGMMWLNMTMLGVIGFFVYPVINLIVILALDLTSKKAIGTVAGFIGLLGYIGRTAEAKGFGMMLEHFKKTNGDAYAWNIVIASIFACSFIAMAILALTWQLRPRGAKAAMAETKAKT